MPCPLEGGKSWYVPSMEKRLKGQINLRAVAADLAPTGKLRVGAGSASGLRTLWWTRTQRIRTAAEIPFEVALLDTSPPPVYQCIARKALHLRKLGLTS